MFLFNQLVVFIHKLLSLFRKEEAKEQDGLLKLDLQFFAAVEDEDSEDDSDDSDDDSGDDDSDDSPSLDELLKDKKFKKQYQAKLKEQLNKRLKKFEGVDTEEYRRLKEQADSKDEKEKDIEDKKSDVGNEKLLRAERREKRAIVKEFAVDNGHSPKLLARLIDLDAIELDDDGDPVNLDDLFDEIEEEFPEYFTAKGDSEDQDEKESKSRKSTYIPGAKQKGNKEKKSDEYKAARERARELLKRK